MVDPWRARARIAHHRAETRAVRHAAAEAIRVRVGARARGAVTVVMNGHHKLQSINISPEVIDAEDPEMLQDLIIAAVNEASEKAGELATKSLASLTGGLGLPGLM